MTDEKADRSEAEVQILTELATIRANVIHITTDIATIKEAQTGLSERFVTRREWEPFKRALYSAVGVLLGGLALGAVNFFFAP